MAPYHERNHGKSQGIVLKKKYGQHFLHDQSIVDHMLEAVTITPQTSIFEIGCGEGFLTRSLLKTPVARLWVFEIDPEWACYVEKTYPDPRLLISQANILDVDFAQFDVHKPWTLLANLPYQVTFPILHLLQQNRYLLKEGVVMIQEEVAQKLTKTSGRGYGFPALFFQHYFELKLLDKVPPTAFYPPPKVHSRLIYFKPRAQVQEIPDEKEFWKFIKLAFHQPRRTLKNNLAQTHLDLNRISADLLGLRAQELNMSQLVSLWEVVRHA
jgi:16S rRNA (adenine1518-N6/adenine1519-N6)-dimethyltransferase